MLVVRAAGQDPRRFGGRNLISDILRHRRRDGSFDGFVSYTSFAIFALRRSGVSRQLGHDPHRGAVAGAPPERRRRLQRRRRGASGIDDTGYAAQALAAAGGRGAALRRAASFLARAQNSNGGFPLSRGGAPNAQSTTYAIQGLVAAGGHDAAMRRGQSYLRSLTEPNGLVRYSRKPADAGVGQRAGAAGAQSRTF